MKKILALFCINFLLFAGLLIMWSCDGNTSRSAVSEKTSDLLQAEQLKNRGSYDSAIILFRKTSDENLKLNQNTEWVNSVSGLIDCYRLKGDMDEALRLSDQALAIAAKKIDTTGNLYNNLILKKANLLSDKRQLDQAIPLYSRNIKIYIARPSIPDTGLALAYNGMGTIYLLQNNYPKALEQYTKAIQTYEKSNYTRNTNYTNSLQNIGIVYSSTGNYEKAEQFFLKSLKVNQEILSPGDSKLATLYINMGRFYQIVRNDSKAIEYLKQAENFYSTQNLSNSVNAGSLFLNMGNAYIYTADYEKAQSYLNKSLEIITAKAPGNLADLLTLYLNMGVIAEKKGEYSVQKEYLLK